jgi:hypothetical protein
MPAPDDRDMTKPLDVLVIESHPGAAAEAVQSLKAAGHHVLRCYDDDSNSFPCLGVTDPAECPLARRTDVALLVRRRVAPRPTALEQGATCAIRAGVPLVEAGPEPLDPFEPWLAARVDDNVVATCEAVSDTAIGELRREILRLAAPILFSAGILTTQALCRIEPEATRLHVQFDLPAAVTTAVKQALAVRVLDAVRGAGRTYGPVHVSVHDAREAGPHPRRERSQSVPSA